MQRKINLLSSRSAVKWVHNNISNKAHTHTHKSAFANLFIAPMLIQYFTTAPDMQALAIIDRPTKQKMKCYRLCYAVRKEAAMCINV